MRSAALLAILTLCGCGRTELLFDGSPVAMDGSVASSAGTTTHVTVTLGGTEGSATIGVTVSSSSPTVGCTEADRPWLLFELDGADSRRLYAIRSDGSSGHRVPLAHDGPLYASMSTDGTKLLYVAFEPETDGGDYGTLYLDDLTTRTTTALLSSGEPPLYSSLSGDGQTIAYTQGLGIYAMDADGEHSRLVIDAPSGATFGYGHPLFVGATATLLYGAYEAFASVKTDGSDNVTLITESNSAAGFFPNPASSPDVARVAAAVECDDDDATWLRVYRSASLPGSCDSGAKVAMTTGYSSAPNEAANPSWGPTNLIAYGDAKDVYVVSPDGGAPRNMTAGLTTGMNTAFDPIWAPGCAPIP
jgi:hypothetical protein